jgi:hypothetical protein
MKRLAEARFRQTNVRLWNVEVGSLNAREGSAVALSDRDFRLSYSFSNLGASNILQD